ncbi:hypothetical protein PHMEG_00016707 [Phytophthora megakarya]|uniref:Uncharacterized protein n=1 Tax=Phytophthora megakarya TaxID=4795 RepID=A0A225W0Q3_9STRA|nr:hypothetical protein PHMEG_00016707 [Phytophthora megakarya]
MTLPSQALLVTIRAYGSIALGEAIAFKYIWKELRKIGWTSKAPLDSCYTYIRPGGRLDGDDGVDYFVGELAVFRYYSSEREMEAASAGLVISDATRSPDTEGGCGVDGQGDLGDVANDAVDHGPPAPIEPVLMQNVYVDKLVTFNPDKEKWMNAKAYRTVGAAYIIGRVCRQAKMGKYNSLFHILWGWFRMESGTVLLSLEQTIQIDVYWWNRMSDFKEDTTLKAFDPEELLPTSLAEVEAITSMRFDPSVQLDTPSYLYRHADGTSKTYARPEFLHLFEHSASSSFFAYIPFISGVKYLMKPTVTRLHTTFKRAHSR